MTTAPVSPPAQVAAAEGGLPAEIASAIKHLVAVSMAAAGFHDAMAANRNILSGVDDLYAAILARLTAAESARDAAVAERDEALKELGVAWLTHSAAVLFKNERDAALARAERLEEALRDCVIQIEYEHGKFGGTGSGETVLHRTRALLAEESKP